MSIATHSRSSRRDCVTSTTRRAVSHHVVGSSLLALATASGCFDPNRLVSDTFEDGSSDGSTSELGEPSTSDGHATNDDPATSGDDAPSDDTAPSDDHCGNGIIEGDEACDGTELGASDSCDDVGLGLPSEALGCTQACTLDFGECSSCGDGVLTDPEVCEVGMLGTASCESLGFSGGTLGCSDCGYDTSACETCGDGSRGAGEACDGDDLGSASCASQGFAGGTLGCAADCTFDVAACDGMGCGDETINGDEACDGDDLGGASCVSRGFPGGSLACTAECGFDESGCHSCGDGVVDAPEQCDGSVGAATCASVAGLANGTLTCSNACIYDTSDCSGDPALRVFITSSGFAADFGGALGGDAACQSVADDAGLGGTFRAWLSDSTTTPLARFTHAGPYALVNGTVVADDWDDLVDGSIHAAIGIDELGQAIVPDATTVATATSADGTLQPFNGNCQDWSTTSGGQIAGVGNEENMFTWSDSGATGCNVMFSLYCFEQ
jgi:hypothetical protein